MDGFMISASKNHKDECYHKDENYFL